MNRNIFLTLFVMIFLLGLIPFSVQAQDATCTELVQSAYDLAREVCESIGDDEACYGNLSIDAAPDDLAFSEPGDLTGVEEIESLRLSSMIVDTNEWGISLIHVAVLVEDEDTPQVVELVLFGNVEIENATEEGSGLAPFQAFTFRSGVGDRPCDEAPDSGLMIQTPAGVGEITLLVNEVTIELGSTAFLQADANGEMAVNIVEGGADVSGQGTTVTVEDGARTRVPLDANGLADGPPEGPEPYDEESLQTLPISLLAQPVAIAPAREGFIPFAGLWTATDCNGSTASGTIAADAEVFAWTTGVIEAIFARTETGSYHYVSRDGADTSDSGVFQVFQFVSEDRMESVRTIGQEECEVVFTR